VNERPISAEERGLLILLAVAVLASGILFYTTRPVSPPASSGNRSGEPIVLEDVAVVVPIFRDPAPIDPNRATVDELVRLPGIGEVLAGRIIAYRDANGRFETIDDLLNVRGIGPNVLDGFRDQVAIGDESAKAPVDQ